MSYYRFEPMADNADRQEPAESGDAECAISSRGPATLIRWSLMCWQGIPGFPNLNCAPMSV